MEMQEKQNFINQNNIHIHYQKATVSSPFDPNIRKPSVKLLFVNH